MAAGLFPSRAVGMAVFVGLLVLMAALFAVGCLLAYRKKWGWASVCLGVAMFLFYAVFPRGLYYLRP